MKNFRKKRRLFKMDIKTKLHVTNLLGNSLVVIRKSKVILTLNELTSVEMCILDLSKLLMYKFHYD